ncbi:Rpn family recombination-promoting nuclease/putative transposase [Tissierella creatinophila]|uniref:Transposase (putative) YhgA-like domain-containing protein n=1 Tax=Tissierella creatinophila DSM 6911 TaxID=1123403 RepID=A0A1U7M7H5_TISCR|nr:Rpn family recombination-promoting nuclease/putative transposase [Tissierella creatinophila]OLS03284.1 hypothetical protein TICRE_07120 [Tissierella creatinophila DSM 6911]
MGKLNQPHDKYFRSTFGEIDFTKDFLTNYLPEELVKMIDMNTLTSQPTSYISKDFKEQFTDLLFRVDIMEKEAYIYFLFEHKSYRDRMVIFQVLKYMIAVWEAKIQDGLDRRKNDRIIDTGDIEIPLVIPLVVYHDKYRWNIKRTLGEMIANYSDLPDSIKKYVPDFEYMLTDLSFSDEGEGLSEDHAIVIRTLNQARYASKDEILDIFTEAITVFTNNKDEDMVDYYIIESMTYILTVREDISAEELFEVAGQISKKGGELVMTAAEKLRKEGIKEGIELGEQKGELKGIRKAIKRVLLRRFKTSNLEIDKSLERIENKILLEDMLDEAVLVESLDEFQNILDEIAK